MAKNKTVQKAADIALSDGEVLELAAKIEQILMVIGLLDEREIAAMNRLKESIADEASKLHAVAGLLVPLHEANYKLKQLSVQTVRIESLIKIVESNKQLQEAGEELDESKKHQETINNMFGL